MEFMSRGNSPQPAPQTPASNHRPAKKRGFNWNGKAIRIEWFAFTLLVALVLVGAIGLMVFNNWNTKTEADYIKAGKYQAIFLNGGSTSGSVDYTTYFGHVSKVTDKYIVLNNIYYLTTSTSSDGKTVTPQLTKLGCQQLHSPNDEMIINRSQVAFWENLDDSGKVVTAIKDYIKANPNGPDCSSTSSSASQTTTSTQSSAATKTTP